MDLFRSSIRDIGSAMLVPNGAADGFFSSAHALNARPCTEWDRAPP
jgi:hypothetical protein